MSTWHYSWDAQTFGPFSLDELKAKIGSGQLSEGTLVWEAGTKDWIRVGDHQELWKLIQEPPQLPGKASQPLSPKDVPPPLPTVSMADSAQEVARTGAAGPVRKRRFLVEIVDVIPALSASLFIVGVSLAIAVPLLVPAKGISSSGNEWAGAVILGSILFSICLIFILRPKTDLGSPSLAWKRSLAKLIDFSLLAALIPFLIFATGLRNPGIAALALWAALIIGWIVIEVLLLNSIHTTLGRKLLGIEIKPISSSPTGHSYFTRSLSVVLVGIAVGIPFIASITQAIAYKRFRETGSTFWDQNRFAVTGQPIGFGRVVIALLVLAFLMSLGGAIANSVGRQLALQRAMPFSSEKEKLNWDELSPTPPSAAPTSDVEKFSGSATEPWKRDWSSSAVGSPEFWAKYKRVGFDVAGALKVGYTPKEIADYLSNTHVELQISDARKGGYSDAEIISHLLPIGESECKMWDQFEADQRRITCAEYLRRSTNATALCKKEGFVDFDCMDKVLSGRVK